MGERFLLVMSLIGAIALSVLGAGILAMATLKLWPIPSWYAPLMWLTYFMLISPLIARGLKAIWQRGGAVGDG